MSKSNVSAGAGNPSAASMDEAVREVLSTDISQGKRSRYAVVQADCLDFLGSLPDGSVDLVIGSPPYCDARTYGIDAVYGCQEWVEWMVKVTRSAIRVCKGLVVWICAGVQRENCYWPAPEGLMWEWWKSGGHLWAPCVWWKVDNNEGGTGIPGSGGKQGLRKDWEYALMFKQPGHLPYADPLVMGHVPVFSQVGGQMSNRTQDGTRADEQRLGWNAEGTNRRANGKRKKVLRNMPSSPTGHDSDGNITRSEGRPMPKIANPGNVLANMPEDDLMKLIVKARVGGGHMGNRMCSLNEAPFPEALPEFFIRSFSAPGDVVADCFVGSGTTPAVAVRNGRRCICCDLRASQVELTRKRVSGETLPLFAE